MPPIYRERAQTIRANARELLAIRTLPPLIAAASLNALLTMGFISWAPAFMGKDGMDGDLIECVAEPAYDKLGWHISDTHGLSFDGCVVPEENLLGERGQGYKQFLKTLDDGRIAISALAVGLAQACLEQTTQYAKTRTAFGKALTEAFQVGLIAKLPQVITVQLAISGTCCDRTDSVRRPLRKPASACCSAIRVSCSCCG